MFETLIETETLAAHIEDPDWVVFDCRSSITDPEAGPSAYATGHIPGARHIHLERELSGPVTPESGRHPLPDPRRLAGILGRAGVGARSQVIAYDDANGAYAARLWWLLRWLRHPYAAVLNGGWQQWLKENRPVSTAAATRAAKEFPFSATAEGTTMPTVEVLELVRGRKRGLLFDARAAVRYHGDAETVDSVAGHIPGAINLPFADNVDEDGRFKCPAELRRRFEQALAGIRPEQTVFMCGSGVTACHNLLAMEIAGLKGGRLYPGSWSEWIRDSTRPVARG